MPSRAQPASRTKKAAFQFPSSYVLSIRLDFTQFGILAGALEATKQPFKQKVADNQNLTDIEKASLDMLNVVDELMHEQAKVSTSHLSAQQTVRGLEEYQRVNRGLAAAHTAALASNIRGMMHRARR